MGRRAARALHGVIALIGLVLYVVFVIPRWWVLTGDIPTAAAVAGRIATGVVIAAGAVPVGLVLKDSLSREQQFPELALRLRAWSGLLHVIAGMLIALTGIAEIWTGLDAAGPWLFAVYGAAGSIAILGVLAFWLSFVAEKPPAEPTPVAQDDAEETPEAAEQSPEEKPKRRFGRRGRKDVAPAAAEALDTDETVVEEETVADEPAAEESVDESDADTADAEDAPDDAATLRNKRPTGKSRHRLRR